MTEWLLCFELRFKIVAKYVKMCTEQIQILYENVYILKKRLWSAKGENAKGVISSRTRLLLINKYKYNPDLIKGL